MLVGIKLRVGTAPPSFPRDMGPGWVLVREMRVRHWVAYVFQVENEMPLKTIVPLVRAKAGTSLIALRKMWKTRSYR